MFSQFQSKEELQQLLQQSSVSKVAINCGVSEKTIYLAMCRLGIPTRRRQRPHLSARGARNTRWKGGRVSTGEGYIKVYAPNHPQVVFGYVLEHRLIMERKIGRYLLPTEFVHHKNGIRDDNREENLELISPGRHSLRTLLCEQCSLPKEIKLLKERLKQCEASLQLRLK